MVPTVKSASFLLLLLSGLLLQSLITYGHTKLQSDTRSGIQEIDPSALQHLQLRDVPPWDPNNQIRCIGDIPLEWRMVLLRNADETTESTADSRAQYEFPRQLCASSVYGGSPVWNLGISCLVHYNPRFHHQAIFLLSSRSSDTQVPLDVFQDMTEFCRLRCRCVYRGWVIGPARPAQEITDSEATIPSPYDFNLENHRGLLFDLPSGAIGHFMYTAFANPNSEGSGVEIAAVGRAPAPGKYRKPFCNGPSPSWELPSPFTDMEAAMLLVRITHPAPFLDRLCKAQWFGGSPKGNAGLVCIRRPNSEYVLEAADFLAQYVSP